MPMYEDYAFGIYTEAVNSNSRYILVVEYDLDKFSRYLGLLAKNNYVTQDSYRIDDVDGSTRYSQMMVKQ